MSDSVPQFTVPAAAEAVAAVIGDRDLIIQGGRRYTYAQVVERVQPARRVPPHPRIGM